jgi:solute carrier family 66, member 2
VWDSNALRRYWQFLLYLFIGLTACELILAPMHSIYPLYSALIGYVGLSVEATLPLPQIMVNARSRSCKGFRVSVLATWLLGDAMKMFWFFTSTTQIPWAFKLCGIFQAGCDMFLGVQYLMYGNGETSILKEHPMAQMKPAAPWAANGRMTPNGRRTPLGD